MICSHCGKSFQQGLVRCPHCGKLQQLVPDYFEAEEEILRDREPEEDTGASAPKKTEDPERKGSAARRKEALLRKKRCRRRILIGILIAVLIGVICGALLYRQRRNSSYDAQMDAAQTALEKGNYESALSFASRALSLDQESIEARELLYEISVLTGTPEPEYLTQILKLDPANETAYTLLISYYDDADDYDAILNLAGEVPDEELLSLFDGVLTEAPSLSPEGGSYEHNTSVTITSSETVYYTTDGTMPDEDSEVYEEEILLSEGTWNVTAIAIDEDGRCSLAVTAEYIISLSVPSAVTFSPSGGSYDTAVSITLRADDDCTIYYAWDASDEDDLTTEYTGPITLPEGNHILSAVAVSMDGISSAVRSRSYIYLPDESEE